MAMHKKSPVIWWRVLRLCNIWGGDFTHFDSRYIENLLNRLSGFDTEPVNDMTNSPKTPYCRLIDTNKFYLLSKNQQLFTMVPVCRIPCSEIIHLH